MTVHLEDEYAGDERWNRFVQAHRQSPKSGECFDASMHDSYGLSAGAFDMLLVAYSYFGSPHISDWIGSPLELLGNESPLSCMEDPQLHNRIRVYLMQLP